MLDLLNVEPHIVSRDLRGYTVLMYGEPKSGKTTTATKFPKHLILGFEKGWSAIPGAMAISLNSWGDFKKILRQLKDEKVKEKYETIIIDTADIAYDYCEKHICNLNGVDSIGDVPYGKGYTLVGKEFDECLRLIVQLNFGLVLISHSTDKTFTNEQGNEYQQIVPTLPNKARLICQRMCDIIGFSKSIEVADGYKTRFFMRGTSRFVAGSRFKYTPDFIDFSYQNLVDAIGKAIDQQMAEEGEEFFTDERGNLNTGSIGIDFDEVMKDFTEITASMMKINPQFYSTRIIEIVEKELGKGAKVSECSRDKAEAIDLIVFNLKELLEKQNK